MKLLLSSLLLFPVFLFSQSVPNSGFENWYNVGGWFDDPVDWRSNNTSIMAPGVYRDSVAYQGILSMQVANVTSIPGYVYSVFPRMQFPTSITAEIRSNILSGDTCFLKARIFYNGTVVDSGIYDCTISLAGWTHINIPVSPIGAYVDTVEISVTAGQQVGSWISVDELNIETLTNISPLTAKPGFQIFPNPMTESAEIKLKDESGTPSEIRISDLSGKVIRIQDIRNLQQIRIERGDLSAGCYFLCLYSNQNDLGSVKLLVD